MVEQVAALQALVIGVVLVWSSYGKLVGPLVAARARRTALASLVGERFATPAFRTVGGVEWVIGAALLVPPLWTIEAVAVTALAVGFLGYLTYALVVAPESSCGCMGSAAAPVSWRSTSRAGLLLAAAILALTADGGWWSAVADRPVAAAVAVLLEATLFVALSAELDRHWLMPLRRLRVRLTHPLAGTASFDVPLASTQQQLLRSGAYRSVSDLLRSDVRDHWDEGEWRFVSYTATYDGRSATAVFAVPRLRYEPEDVRVAIVDEEKGETLYKPALLPVLAS
ncbi:MAG TPA: MauE/DoxX family redox-associated membrane protein [Kribbella sp.]|nr:MauE/DoxX family redox-associated membrane protein [Kribbella sp.]